MIAKTYLGKLTVTIGEYSNTVSLLVAANSDQQARNILDDAARTYYGADDDETQSSTSGYFANGGELHTAPSSLFEISRTTFNELTRTMRVCTESNVDLSEPVLPEPIVKDLAGSIALNLERRGTKVPTSVVLEAIAGAAGMKNWQVLKNKFKEMRGGLVPNLLVLESGDGRPYDMYALVPSDMDIEKVSEEMSTWLEEARTNYTNLQADEETSDPEEGDWTEEDVQKKLTELGCTVLTSRAFGPQWD